MIFFILSFTRRKVTNVMIILAMVGFGIISSSLLPLELMPKSDKSILSIITRYPGNSPSKIEELITRPIENQAMIIGGIDKMLSSSEEGESRVTLYFNENVDMKYKAVELKSRLDFARDKFPRDVEDPYIVKFNPNDNAMMIINVNSKNLNLKQLRELSEKQIKKYIEKIDGVGEVIVSGGRFREINIDINHGRLIGSKIKLTDVMDLLRITNKNEYLGKVINSNNSEVSVRLRNRIEKYSEINKLIIPISEKNTYIQLKDIANIYDGERDIENINREKGIENVSIHIKKNGDANIINTCSKIENDIKNFKINDAVVSISYNEAEYIESAIDSVTLSAYLGAIACSIVIILFLKNIPLTFIVVSTIPISVLFSLTFFHFLGLSLNVMSMAGLALGIGILIDNAIVMIEKISLYTKDTIVVNTDLAIDQSIGYLWKELLASSLTNIVVFIPLFFVSNELRQTFSDLAISITACVFISYFLSIFWIPTLTRFIPINGNIKFPSLRFSKLNFVLPILKLIKIKKLPLFLPVIISFGITLIGFISSIYIDKDFIDVRGQKEIRASVELKTGTNLNTTSLIVKEVERLISLEKFIERVDSKVEKWHADLFIKLNQKTSKSELNEYKNILKDKVSHLTDVFVYFFDGGTSSTNEIDIDLIGDNFDTLKQISKGVANKINEIPETSEVVFRFRDGKKEGHIILQKEKLLLSEVSTNEISQHLKTAIQGSIPTKLFEKNKEVDLRLRFRNEDRDTFSEIIQSTVVTNKNPISISQVSMVKLIDGETKIYRKNKRRMVSITASYSKIDATGYINKLDESLKEFEFPQNYYYEFGDSILRLKKSQFEMFIFILFAIFLIYSVLAILFQSYVFPILIIFNVPFIIMSVTLTLFLLGYSYNISVYIGFVMLSGLTINNSIMILENYLLNKDLINSSNYRLYKCIKIAVRQRKRAMKMTSLTTGIAMFPSIFIQSDGSEFWRPMSIVIILGMIYSYISALKVFPRILFLTVKYKNKINLSR